MNAAIKKYTFTKKEHLCKNVEINKLFNDGSSFTIYPLRFIYLIVDEKSSDSPPIQLLVSAPKKFHKKAVKRNLIKRRLREAYRKLKPSVYSEEVFKNLNIFLGIIYISNDIITYQEIEKKVILGVRKLTTEIEKRNSFY